MHYAILNLYHILISALVVANPFYILHVHFGIIVLYLAALFFTSTVFFVSHTYNIYVIGFAKGSYMQNYKYL